MARSAGPGKDSGKSTTKRSGPVTACTDGETRWLVSISISVAPPTFNTSTRRTCAAGPDPLRAGESNSMDGLFIAAGATRTAGTLAGIATGAEAEGAIFAALVVKTGAGVGGGGGGAGAASASLGAGGVLAAAATEEPPTPSPIFTTTDLLEGNKRNDCADFRSTTTRVTGGLDVTRPTRTAFTSP